ncbi:hypothetical protein OIO90_003267 [Microbotryomycetes sp. JL221]|nr:hypothetical protein OIO90_003267 [Microbotryomycetes sp. JL221]
MSAIYSIYTSPNQRLVQDCLPTLLVTPHGRPSQILYTYLHTNSNSENYLLTPSDAGDVVVAKLQPPTLASMSGAKSSSSASTSSQGAPGSPHANTIRCEASRNLRWSIHNVGLQNPTYKMTVPNPQEPGEEQPLFQVSKPNPYAPYWTLFYFTYAGHLIPPERIEFGRIQKNSPESGGGTRVTITGRTESEAAVWKTLGDSNEDMVEWIVICAALAILDDEIKREADRNGTGALMPPSMPIAAGAVDKSRTPSPANSIGGGGARQAPQTLPPWQQQQQHSQAYQVAQDTLPPRERQASSSSSTHAAAYGQQHQIPASRQPPAPSYPVGVNQPEPSRRYQLQDRPVERQPSPARQTPQSQPQVFHGQQQAYNQSTTASSFTDRDVRRPEPTYAYEQQQRQQQGTSPARSYSNSPAGQSASASSLPSALQAGSNSSRQASVSPSQQQQQAYYQQQQQQQQPELYYQQQQQQQQQQQRQRQQYQQHNQPTAEPSPRGGAGAKLRQEVGAKRAAAGIQQY